MAFHFQCPITCRRICYCKMGFPPELRSEKARNEFASVAARVQELFNNPGLVFGKPETVQVLVPKVGYAADGPEVIVGGDDDVEEVEEVQKKVDVVSVGAEDYPRRVESGDVNLGLTNDAGIDDQILSSSKVWCRLCFSGEDDGSYRAKKMISCKSCNKKYHKSCVKSWAQHRDLFHWSSWNCPSCRSCEVCGKTGDPNKLMFCKRCDSACHCYCQQPSHKNVSSGPYLCPKHTKCHSCASTVPGNGLSVRWFLGYTCCDACGRLFVKGNYCPVCLKVYRDSESTPMVCCDVCQRWVHCLCDGISDEKYLQFQVDNNLQYRCATCRGDCYKVKDLEDTVQELWRRRDKDDRELTASLRAAAGLPAHEEIFSISDDEDNRPLTINEHTRSLKFSLKGGVEKSPKRKSASKKNNKRKAFGLPLFGGQPNAQSTGFITSDNNKDESSEHEIAGSLTNAVWSNNDAIKNKSSKKKSSSKKNNNRKAFNSPVFGGQPDARSTGLINSDNSKDENGESEIAGFLTNAVWSNNDVMKKTETRKTTDKSSNSKGPKLVIHLGSRNKNVTNLHSGNESSTNGGNSDRTRLKIRGKEGNTIKIKKLNPENVAKPRVLFKKGSDNHVGQAQKEKNAGQAQKEKNAGLSQKEKEGIKPLLRLKFKTPYAEKVMSWAPSSGVDDMSLVKGQRSKRKRPSPVMDAKSVAVREDEVRDAKPVSIREDEGASRSYGDDEIMDANWIIQKLGKDAIGKKVEVHQRSNSTWHKGTVIKVYEGTSIITVLYDDEEQSNVDLKKQGIRFYSVKRWQYGKLSSISPSPEIIVDGKLSPNPDYASWLEADQRVLLLLQSSFYVRGSRCQPLNMPTVDALRQLKKGNLFVQDYAKKFKSLCDQLAAIAQPVKDMDKMHWFLCGLGPAFENFSTAQRAIYPPPAFRDLLARAESHELFMISLHCSAIPTAAFAAQHQPSRYRGSSSKGRGRQFSGGQGWGKNPTRCQLCRTEGHYAYACPQLPTFQQQATTYSAANLAKAFTPFATSLINHQIGVLTLLIWLPPLLI
ncbi:uncharacterized protein LOC143624760 [Bidens hawaiensis]|uniref:uncharacterized protein LOC143624760 n=1 Tax=Bidens hawaiensis TaxID=980011 RepID=UPI00404997F4